MNYRVRLVVRAYDDVLRARLGDDLWGVALGGGQGQEGREDDEEDVTRHVFFRSIAKVENQGRLAQEDEREVLLIGILYS